MSWNRFSSHNPTDERVLKAIARMNYLHSRYQKAGKISNEDLLYTLSVFITEPVEYETITLQPLSGPL